MAEPKLEDLLNQMTDSELQEFISHGTPDAQLLPEDVRPVSKDITGIYSNALKHSIFPVTGVTDMGVKGLGDAYNTIMNEPQFNGQNLEQILSKKFNIPEAPQVPETNNANAAMVGPLAQGVNQINPTILSELLKAPGSLIGDKTYRDTFFKGVAATVAGEATRPINWLLPKVIEGAGMLPVGKTNLKTLAMIDPSKWEAAFAGKRVRVRPAFFNTQEATEIAQFLKNSPERLSELGAKAKGIAQSFIDDMSPKPDKFTKTRPYRNVKPVDDYGLIKPTPLDINAPLQGVGGQVKAGESSPLIPNTELGTKITSDPNVGLNERGSIRIKKSYKDMSTKELRNELHRIKRESKVPIPNTNVVKIDKETGLPDDLSQFRDITKMQKGFLGLTRQIEKVASNYPEEVSNTIKNRLVEPIKNAVTDMINSKYQILHEVRSKIVKEFGIKEGSKESKAVFNYGEKTLSLQELQKQFPNKWHKIIKADNYFRENYNNLIDAANTVRSKNGFDLINKRPDYYTHIREDGDIFHRLLNPEDTTPSIMETTQVKSETKSPFNPFSKQRTGETKPIEDAITSFTRYLNPILSETHLTEPLSGLNSFRKLLIDKLPEPKKLAVFLDALVEHSEALAGKKNPFDRFVDEHVLPVRIKTGLNWIANRFAKNTILYNISSAISNFIPMTQLATEIGPIKATKALFSSAIDGIGKDEAVGMSKFLQRRFKDIGWSDLSPRGLLVKGEKFGGALFKAIDTLTARATWMGLYDKALSNGMTKDLAIKSADEMADKLLQDRSLGSMPLAFRSNYARIALQFQTEVNNFNSYMIHDIGFKDPKKLATLFAYTFVANRIFENINGRSPLPDPYMAAFDAIQSEDPIKAVGRLSGEVLSNMVGGQVIANMYPMYGKKYKLGNAEINLPTRKKLFGRTESGRFGAIPVTQVLNHPLTSLVTPFGGNQLSKTINGIKVYKDGYIEYGNKVIPIDSIPDKLKSFIFGPSGSKAVRDYFKEEESSEPTRRRRRR